MYLYKFTVASFCLKFRAKTLGCTGHDCLDVKHRIKLDLIWVTGGLNKGVVFDGDVVGIIHLEEMDNAASDSVGFDPVLTVWSCGGSSADDAFSMPLLSHF